MMNRFFVILPMLTLLGAFYSATANAACVANTVTATVGAGGVLDPSTPSPVNICTDERAKFRLNAKNGYYISNIGGCGGVPFTNQNTSTVFASYSTGKITANCTVTAGFSAASTGVSELPQTGQSKCYDADGVLKECAGTGQDGDIKAGTFWPRPRFTDNGNGTVTDSLTGLIWLKDANCGTTIGGIIKPAGFLHWADALTWTNKLATKSCGLTDGSAAGAWRLPSVNELESLLHLQNVEPSLSTGHLFSNIQANSYWTSSTYASGTGGAWGVDMATGSVLGINKSTYFFVLPVRDPTTPVTAAVKVPATGQTGCWNGSGTSVDCTGTGQDGAFSKNDDWLDPRFQDNNDGTLNDTLTGLDWPLNGNSTAATTWQGALDYIADLNTNNYLGKNDWRLPNRKELMSLVSRQQSNNAAWLNDQQGFSNVQADNYWTSSTYVKNAKNAWYVNMNSGSANNFSKGYNFYVWPVRGGSSGIPVISVSPDSYAFDKQDIFTTSTEQEFIISNDGSGSAKIDVSSIALTGGNIGVFSLSNDGTCGTNPLLPGDFCSVFVTFSPSSTGVKSTALRIASNTPATPIKDVIISGQGALPTFTIGSGVVGGYGNISCTSPVAIGKKSICTITSSAGYHLSTFSDNTDDKLSSVTNNIYTINNVTANHTVAGIFSKITAGDPVIIINKNISNRPNLVDLTLAYSPGAVKMQFLIDNAASWTKWESFASAKTVKLPATTGLKTISVRFKDAQGSESPVYSASIMLDTATASGWILINNGASVTGSATVNLTMGTGANNVIGTTQMCVKETSAACSDVEFENYANSKDNYIFQNTVDGKKTLFLSFKDSVGKVSKPVMTSIILDTAAPTGSIAFKGGKTSTTSSIVTLKFTASKVVYMQLSLDGGTSWGEWESFVKTKVISLSADKGPKTVKVKYKDFAEHESPEYSASIELL